ncbi:helicase-exonuclease AddAB subunit AddB [Bacillus shivajii]|uniref:helicase-exonuclease AddAB subunit AddB n=1 Tax=Bacillus shivajii TaxID=1983719 RepID=UPI001CFC3539|nr:helicase-exonuclease AddAB subunit AddB [Bacillus shivajii]UCZ55121.1 helicase-exonuclease AddAB subunit AddB [Bacillus shivajii]
MAITFYIGRSGTGKSTHIQQDMINKLKSQPTGNPIIYLVPDQMTFQTEMNFIQSDIQGMTRAQVFSFSRLALRVLQETGGISRHHLQRTGLHMLIRKIVEKEKDKFSVFKRSTETNGFIDELEQIVTEFKRYDVKTETLDHYEKTLREKEERSPQEAVLLDKLHDVKIVFENLEYELADQYVGTEDYLALLAEQIPKSTYLQNAEVYIDGFYSFTPLELNVLQELLAHTAEVNVVLTLDKHYDTDELVHELDLFHETGNTYQQLSFIAKEQGVQMNEPVSFSETKRFKTEGLKHLEKYGEVRPPVPCEENDGIEMIAAVHKRAEVEGVAREILNLVRNEGYQFKDVAVLLRNMESYGDLIETVCRDYSIPIFMDKKRSMLNHPVIELIRSALDIIDRNWRYEDVFRCFKTDLLFPLNEEIYEMRERVDQLENYVLSYGIQGARWYQKEPWTYQRVRTTAEGERKRSKYEEAFEREINDLKTMLTAPLIQLAKRMKTAKTSRDRCTVIYQFLEDCDVPKKLEWLRDQAIKTHDLERAREHDQVWNAVIELLDQMVELTGEEQVSFSLFRKLVETGVESMKFSIIPPALDQVIVADMEHSRLSDVKVAFILGVNEGVLPAKPEEGGIVSEEERELLGSEGLQLAPGSTRQLLNESFIIYLAQSTPSDLLYFTYPLADEEGRSMQPSILLKRIKDLFPNLEEKLWFNEPVEVPFEEQSNFVQNPAVTLSYLTYQLQSWKKGYEIPDFWWGVYNWFVEHPTWRKETEYVLKSLFYENKAKPLPKETSRAIYGDEIKTSVSRIEKFQGCPFSQFASHGLKLQERESYKLEAPDIGTLFHAALKEMAEHLKNEGRDFAQLTKNECTTLSKQIVDQLAPKIQREILLSSNRYSYIKQKLEEVVARASSILAEQSKASGFSPVGLEVGFGPKEDLPPLTFTLDNGVKMELIGRIDRVDKSQTDHGLMLRIIDYKSSKKDIKLMDVYYGLAIQMLIYLDVVLSHSDEWLGQKASPAGVLYFHVHNPLIQSNKPLSIEQLEEEIFKQFKMKGLLPADPEIIREMDTTLEQGVSNIIPAGLKKDGSLHSRSSVISEADYEVVRNYLRKQVEQVGTALTEGKIDITPVKNKQQVACTFCPYGSFCQFDPTIETNEYNTLNKLEPDDILQKMREEGGDSDER